MAGKTITRTQRDRRATGLRRVSPRRPRRAAPSLPPGQGQRQGRTQRQLRPGAARYPHPRPCRRADPPEHPTSFPLQFYQRPGSRAGDRRPALTRISPEIARYAGPGSARSRLPPLVSFVSSWRLPPAALTPAAPAPGPASLFAFGHVYQTEAGGGAGLPPPQGRRGARGPSLLPTKPLTFPRPGWGGGGESLGAQGSPTGGGALLGALSLCCSVAQSCPILCDPHGLQHARLP